MSYIYAGAAAVGQTTSVVIQEHPPIGPRGKVIGGSETRISGRSVSLLRPTPAVPSFYAQWKTRAARYVAIANGTSVGELARFVACMP